MKKFTKTIIRRPVQSVRQMGSALKPSQVKRLVGLACSEKRGYVGVCLLGITMAALEMLPPKLVGHAVNDMAAQKFAFNSILFIAIIWLSLVVVVQLLHGWQIWLAHKSGESVLAKLRQSLFDHLQDLSLGFFDRTHAGRILTTTGADVDSIRGIVIWGMNTFVANAAVMVMASIMIYQTDPELFFATAWLAPLMTGLNFWYGKKVTVAWHTVRSHFSLVGNNQVENIAGVRVVVAFNRQDDNLAHFNQLQRTNTANNVMASRRAGLFQPVLQWGRFIGIAIVLLFGGFRVAQGQLNAGDLVAVILYWDWFMTPALNFGAFFNELLIAMSGAERIFNLLDRQPDVRDQVDARTLPRIHGDVRFENVSFRYQEKGRTILDRVNLDIKSGSMVALVGETGSGKSTIVSLLARFYLPTEGRVLVDGVDITTVAGESLHHQMAMVSQSNFLFSGTVMENLKYARPTARDEEVFAAARELGCDQRFRQLKNGYDTQVGEKGASLSLGERQLVCFTRALVAQPRLLVLDEATSALDPLTGLQVQRAMARLIKGRTTFIVTHRLSTIRWADHIVVVENGRVREQGTHAELLNRNGKYAELHRAGCPAKIREAHSSLSHEASLS